MWCLLLLSMGLAGLQAEYNSERLRVQITVPKKIKSITTDGVESQISYNIAIDGKMYTVTLIQKNFLPHNFKVYSYNGSRSMKPHEQQLQDFCYYRGYIEGYPNSMVIISTCTGLRGLLQFENVTYGIEPLEPSIGFEHVIYKVKHKNAGISLYSEEDVESRDFSYKIQSIQTFRPLSQYIEMHIVVEKKLYEQMGSDVAIVTQKVFQLIGLTNAIFTSFNITVILSSLELWTDENKIPVTGDANELLHRFLRWKKSYLVLRPHDVAFLLVYREKPEYVGAIFQGKMCDEQYSGGIALHPKTISLESLAVIMAQLLSLSMGIAYDDVDKCQCSGTVCIMNPDAIHSTGVKNFSNCSMEDFVHFISKAKSQCLQNQPRLDPSYKAAECGDRELQDGEQCDCGRDEIECAEMIDCCEPTTCKLKANQQCSSEECCDHCKYATLGKECRHVKDNVCDVPEYCNGTSKLCQPDHHVMDGHQCGSGWICLKGTCVNGQDQCSSLIGPDAEFGSPECFNFINSMTDEFGNCGTDSSGPKKCSPENVQCGKLTCIYTKSRILELSNASVLYTNIDGKICVSVHYADAEDSTFVKEGTSCGNQKVCKNYECVESSYLNYNCPKSKCNNQGVCNELGNCHCDPEYLPPDCKTSASDWPGGSIDSGNHSPNQITPTSKSFIENVYRSKPTRWPFFLLIPFFIVLCVLIANLAKVFYQRKRWKTEEYSSDEQLESESESKD
ncbi:disintegrin and metalloproteinase domain-containing protein 2-like isoform X1 [Erinaceus europaeus]|uniref:Disintegrin and metalloproteinase domain-containing protein 2 n=3 Tax=Erinaceus europaeus TaxID=9365 RepID=A0ABM3WNJ2_ERIEU|nr:disintegrin and metalloproteinase domain-containing protein 2-like isoform X1 [Erinaceus europaeus]